MKQKYQQIKQGTNVRENLIELKNMCKEAPDGVFLQSIDYDMDFFRDLLENEDPKVRKNAAQLIEICHVEAVLPDLFDVYQKEETLFVRPAYLKAMLSFNVQSYLPEFRDRRDEILSEQVEETKEKHISEELRYLAKLIDKYEKGKSHYFVGAEEPSYLFLTTPKGCAKVLSGKLHGMSKKVLNDGVLVKCENLESIKNIRCYQECLFVIRELTDIEATPEKIGEKLSRAGIMEYLDDRHIGDEIYPFRLEVRGLLREEKQNYVKKAAMSIESESGHRLVNATSFYDIEFRIMIKKSGKASVFLKLNSWKDQRFAYRTHELSTSMQPSVAALICEYAKPYFKKNARVLDPFCGLGTLLIERNYVLHADTLYGIDTFRNALSDAKAEAKKVKMPIHYINKDMQHFQHEYLFDEIITDLPVIGNYQSKKEIYELYQQFLKAAVSLLSDKGRMIVYTKETAILESLVKEQGSFEIVDSMVIYQRIGSRVYILQRVK